MKETMARRRARAGIWLSPLALAGCSLAIEPTELDAALRNAGVRTVLFADGLSLYSPYEAVPSRGYLEKLLAERDECFALLGVESDEPVQVWLRVDPGLGLDVRMLDGDRMQVEGASLRTDAGINGMAGELQVILLVDAPNELVLADGRTLTGSFDPEQFRGTMRHELTHVATHLLGLPQVSWLQEGIAHAVEFAPAADGRLRFDPPPKELLWAAQLEPEARSIDALLTWQATNPPGPDERAMRLLAFSLVAFLLEREPAATLRDGLLRIGALEPAELRALQSAWSDWLTGLAQAP
jgi:hypothetical protein